MTILKLIMLAVLLASASCVTTITYASSNPYCAAPGELSLAVKQQDQSTTENIEVDFDSISTYYNADFESIPLMVKNGAITPSAKDFAFYSYKNDLTNLNGLACTGTSTYKFVDLIGAHLFMVDNSTSPAVYYVCSYDSAVTTPLTKVQLVTSGLVTGIISQFDPYLNDENKLYVLVGNGIVSQVVSFNAADGTSETVGIFFAIFRKSHS